HVEAGTITLIGATTENPSFEVIGPLLSRCRVFTVRALEPEAIRGLLERALQDPERGLPGAECLPEALDALAAAADGDARRALGMLETATAFQSAGGDGPLTPEAVAEAVGQRLLLHDRDREEHYNVISALIKSLRASDADAALYYAARLLAAGEDPRFLARRLVIFASEDVGNAEPQALTLATSTYLAVERIGMPEARIPLAQAVTFLATAPKSNAAYAALGRAAEAVTRTGSAPVPMHLRNAPTALMKQHGYGEGYRYAHAEDDAFVADRNLPEVLGDERFYEPTQRGAEAEIAERLERWRSRRFEAEGQTRDPAEGGSEE
nr:replication-associated recombination protein A [Myxococcota bacterium]